MTRPAMPSHDDVRAMLAQLRAEKDLPGREPSVLTLARRLGLANTTFRRNYPGIVAELTAQAASRPQATAPPGRYQQLEQAAAELRRDNQQLRDHLDLAAAVIQRLTLENQRLRRQLEDAAKVTRIAAVSTRLAARPAGDLGTRLVRRLVPDARAAISPAAHSKMTAFAVQAATADYPRDTDSSRLPDMSVGTLFRIPPPVWPPSAAHDDIRTYIRSVQTVTARASRTRACLIQQHLYSSAVTVLAELDLGTLARVGTALADPTRRRVLVHLIDGPGYPAEMAEDLGTTRANLSNHLSCLRECGLVTATAEGRRVRYELADRRLADGLRILAGLQLPGSCG